MPNCPNCGDDLQDVTASRGDTPPWVSPGCARGWWDAELSVQARKAWVPGLRSFTTEATPTVARAAALEQVRHAQAIRDARQQEPTTVQE